MNELKIIDSVLLCLNNIEPDNPIREMELFNKIGILNTISYRDRYIILKKLKKDKLIDSMKLKDGINNSEYEVYFITFEGVIFIKNGGYTKQRKRESFSQNLQKVQTWVILFGSLLAAFF